MFRAFELIHNHCKKRHQRDKDIKLIGIKSLECNFNLKSKTYNPHFHKIVPTKEVADLLKKEWLFQWKSDEFLFTSPKAQYIRPVVNLERDLIEIIKYSSKVFTAMKDNRIFDRFGFNLPKIDKIQNSEAKLLSDFEEWQYNSATADWKIRITRNL